jgi:hypothetical protein
MVASPAMSGCSLTAPLGADEKTPASRKARVWVREWICIFLEEATPASVMPGALVEGRFILSVVAMTGLTCFRRKRLLGRNLITLFQCVNSFAKNIFASALAAFHPGPCAKSENARTWGASRCASHPCRFKKGRISCAFVVSLSSAHACSAARSQIADARQ